MRTVDYFPRIHTHTHLKYLLIYVLT